MGVNTLWDILADAGEENVSVTTLRGKRLAVDLSSWIVELRQSKASTGFHNAYIRNLFFRTVYFMKEGVELVFVIDGKAPELKQQALLTRQQNQFGSASNTLNPDRPFLKNAVSQCVEMLGYLGLPYVQSDGEAEAMCARLNSEGLLDGCLTEDNDFFLYGGNTLYRKLRKENKTYSVDKFDMDQIKAKLGLEQRDLVALALLLGSDYDDQKGVKCVGKEKGKALVELLKSRNLDVLDRLLGWRENKELNSIEEKLCAEVKHNTHCSKCEHLGRVSIHVASGCEVCRTVKGCHGSCDVSCQCTWHRQQVLRKEHKLELSLRQKSLENAIFPNKKIVNEFMHPNLSECRAIPKPSMKLPDLMNYMKKRLGWSSNDVLEKIVPVVILKQLRERRNKKDLLFTPVRILRTCKDNHVECYEVTWDKTDQNDWAGPMFSTNILVKIEKSLYESAYPKMVANYEQYVAQKKSTRGKKRKSETVKGQLKLIDYTKIKKRLQFTEETEKLAENNIGDTKEDLRNRKTECSKSRNCIGEIDYETAETLPSVSNLIDLTGCEDNKGAESAKPGNGNEIIIDKTEEILPDISLPVNEVIDITERISDRKPEIYESGPTSMRVNEELGNGKINTDFTLGRNAGKESGKGVCQKSVHKSPSTLKGKGISKGEKNSGKKSRQKVSEVKSQASIVSFLEKKDSRCEMKTLEVKTNDTKAFQVRNSLPASQ